ncbi:MAG: hypothetical protein LBJ69_03260, partial [Holosporales bacterium]|jgi:hypothetical protein|nr:hypothetical protein [Holosporales bacterium]
MLTRLDIATRKLDWYASETSISQQAPKEIRINRRICIYSKNNNLPAKAGGSKLRLQSGNQSKSLEAVVKRW